ncbi:MAG: amidohydrolase family protein [Candidatus Aminicenantales bacterium]
MKKRIPVFKLAAIILFFLFCSFLVFTPECSSGAEKIKALRFGMLVNGKGQTFKNAVLIVKNDRIESVGTDPSAIPEGSELIDLTEYTAIPGLIDVHTHMTYYWDASFHARPWQLQEMLGPGMTTFLAQKNALKTLEAGVTTVRDLGAFDPHTCDRIDIAMRDLIQMGAMIGPRMFVSGYGLLPTFSPATNESAPRHWGTADGVSEVMRIVRREIAAGVDWVKMFASTGSADDLTGYQTYTFEEIKAAVDVAHQKGIPISVHSYGSKAAQDAIRAGADSLEHPIDLSDETLAEMAKKGIFYVPTVDHNRYYADNAEIFGYGPDVVERLHAFIDRNVETTRRAHKAGVRIAMGSDAVFTMFGENTRELAWFIKAGMTPEEALATSTINGAALLGKEGELGALLPGYYADIVAVEGNPLKDIHVVIHNVRWVMKGGKVVIDQTKLKFDRR